MLVHSDSARTIHRLRQQELAAIAARERLTSAMPPTDRRHPTLAVARDYLARAAAELPDLLAQLWPTRRLRPTAAREASGAGIVSLAPGPTRPGP